MSERECPKGLTDCPTPDQLAAFESGKLCVADWDRVADCVKDCSECERRLQQLQHQDPLLD
ncbi:MAG: hypothetical protein N2C14_00710, partial [Planctomycetales bacterium]